DAGVGGADAALDQHLGVEAVAVHEASRPRLGQPLKRLGVLVDHGHVMPVIGRVPGNRRADPPAANDQKLHGISVLDDRPPGRVRPLGCAGFRYRAAVVTGTSPIRIGLLGYGTVGSAVHRLLREGAEAIEGVTGQPVEVAAALVRDPARHPDAPDGLLTTDFARLRDDPDIGVVAEVMGGIEPTREYV